MHTRIVLLMNAALACAVAATPAGAATRVGDPTLEGLKITAERDGTLTLRGRANSRAAAQRALAIAQGSDGVKRVYNRLTIVHRTVR